MSAGNHAQAVAYHAHRLGIDATIVMPASTPFVKVQRTRELGARVVLAGTGLEDARAEVQRISESDGRTYVHPYDDPAVIAGQGTCALELLTDHPELDALAIPVGGGGLLAGSAIVARHLRSEIDLVGVQTERYAAMAGYFHEREADCGGSTLAEGIAVPWPGDVTGPILKALVDDVVTVSEDDIERGINLLLEIEKVVAEGAGATGIAALLAHRERFAGKRVGVILSGGNIDPRLLATLTTLLGQSGANIVEIHHQRLFVDVSAKAAHVELTIETLDHHHADRVIAALREAGYDVTLGTFTNHPQIVS
jgi:threonine dehydratase